MLFSRDLRPSITPYKLIYLWERTENIEMICYPESDQKMDFSKNLLKTKVEG